jgi:Ser/Thr protein kinase RdoA (MazF antagonist)
VPDPPGDLVLLASGRAADVYALAPGLVLRRYRRGNDARAEAEVMAHVAAHGYPVPAVHSADGPDLVMERLDGPTILHAVATGAYDAAGAGRLLAELHDRLHAIPPRDWNVTGARILHLDLHPDNVLLTARGPVVIDWTNAAEGPADLDVALTAVILAVVALDDAHEHAATARQILVAFLTSSRRPSPDALDTVVARRREDRGHTAAERDRLGAAAALVTDMLTLDDGAQDGSIRT